MIIWLWVCCLLFQMSSALFAEIHFIDRIKNSAVSSSCSANGGAFGDYNRDGFPDLFIACLDRDIGSKLYENRGDGTFENRSDRISDVGAAMGGLFVDIDQDGDRDLYAIRFNRRNIWLINDKDKLRPLPDSLLSRGYAGATSASIADFDRDGLLDIFSVYRYSNPNELLLRPAVVGFNSQPEIQSVLSAGRETFSSTVFDYNGDGNLDLYVSHFGYEDALHRNDGTAFFTPVADSLGLTGVNFSVAGIPADYDSDGDFDLYIIHANEKPNKMWLNEEGVKFVHRDVGAEGIKSSSGGSATDWDLDGDIDLLVSNVEGIDVYENDGSGLFFDVSDRALTTGLRNKRKTAGITTSDYDLDGDIDALLFGLEGQDVLLSNESSRAHVIVVDWETKRASNVEVKTTDHGSQYYMTDLDSRLGSSEDLQTFIGLQGQGSVQLHVSWPSGYQQIIDNVSVDQTLRLSEPKKKGHTKIGLVQLPDGHYTWHEYLARVEIINTGEFLVTNLRLRGRVDLQGERVYEEEIKVPEIQAKTRMVVALPGWKDHSGGPFTIQIDLEGVEDDSGNGHWEREVYRHHFVDIAGEVGVDDSGNGWAAAMADGDGDGDIDLYVSNGGSFGVGENIYFRNDISHFSNVTSVNGTADSGNGTGVTFADFDSDGDQDLFMSRGGFLPPGETNRMLFNNGAGRFVDVSNDVGLSAVDASYAAVPGDFDGDGSTDLYVSQFRGQYNSLYRNKNNYFTDEWAERGIVSYQRYSGAAAAFSDLDLDGDIDLYASMFGTYDVFYANRNNHSYDKAQVGDEGDAVGIALGDYDADGDQDVYVVNQNWRSTLWENDIDRKIFVDVGDESGVENHSAGTGCAFGDYDNDGDLDLFVVNGSGPNRVYMNKGNGTFQDVTSLVGMLDTVRARSVVLGDIDDDGDLDPYIVNEGFPNRLYRNEGNSNGWLQVNLRGTLSNTDAIGARLTLYSEEELITRDVNSVAGLAQSSRRVHFGLGPVGFADSLKIVWPRGSRQDIALSSNIRSINLTEGRIPTRIVESFLTVVNQPRVFSNFPNPFNATTRLRFVLTEDSLVRCSIYNMLGQRVRNLIDEQLSAGNHEVQWDGLSDEGMKTGSGIYFYQFDFSGVTYKESMVLLR